MDMNWIDEIRDPEPRKRYIYNADDYDPQYGDPYYREHSTRADSLWRLYEESGTSITFDAFADESRQTDYRMETGALRDFFNGSQSALSSYRNPMGGNPLIAFGSKLAAMPEPSPASQEKDELSAGVCDPTDPTMGCLQPDSPAAIR